MGRNKGRKSSSTVSVTRKLLRRHRGIYQSGPKKGKLKPGYRYSGKRLKSGLAEIVKSK